MTTHDCKACQGAATMTDKKGGQTPTPDGLMRRIGPVIFEKAILDETDHHRREKLVIDFVHSPFTDFGTIQTLLSIPDFLAARGAKLDEIEVMKRYTKLALHIFLSQRTDIQKSGISIQYVFEGETVYSLGHVLNEGVTEMISRDVTHEYIRRTSKDPKSLSVSLEEYTKVQNTDGTYLLEVAAAKSVENGVGEKILRKAYFSPDPEDWQQLARSFEEKCKSMTFLELLQLSDGHQWKLVFAALRESGMNVERSV